LILRHRRKTYLTGASNIKRLLNSWLQRWQTFPSNCQIRTFAPSYIVWTTGLSELKNVCGSCPTNESQFESQWRRFDTSSEISQWYVIGHTWISKKLQLPPWKEEDPDHRTVKEPTRRWIHGKTRKKSFWPLVKTSLKLLSWTSSLYETKFLLLCYFLFRLLFLSWNQNAITPSKDTASFTQSPKGNQSSLQKKILPKCLLRSGYELTKCGAAQRIPWSWSACRNIDWPISGVDPTKKQKRDFIGIGLYKWTSLNFNAVIVRIEPAGDAFDQATLRLGQNT